MAIEYFCCYHSYLEVTEQLNDAEKGRLFTACMEYSRTGKVPQLGGNERFVFPSIKVQIDRDKDAYESKCRKNSENGARGGRPKTQKSERFFEKANGFTENRMVIEETQKSQGKGEGEEKSKGKCKGEGDNPPLPPLQWAGDELRKAFAEWLRYKAERKEAHVPTGLNILEAELKKNAEKYGETAVAALIRQCISSGWQGIIFERLAKGVQKPNNQFQGCGEGEPSEWAKKTLRRMVERNTGQEGEK